MRKATIEISHTGNNYCAHLPILQGVVTTGTTLEQTERNIKERQLYHYQAALRKPRLAQRKRIEEGLHKLAAQLLSISL